MMKHELFRAIDRFEGPDHHDRNETLARTGRWGSCACCPRERGVVMPELCEHYNSSDHDIEVCPATRDLVDTWRNFTSGR